MKGTWEWTVWLSLNPARATPFSSLGLLVAKNLSSPPMTPDYLQTLISKPRLKSWSLTATEWPWLISQRSFLATQACCANCLERQPASSWWTVSGCLHLWFGDASMTRCDLERNARFFWQLLASHLSSPADKLPKCSAGNVFLRSPISWIFCLLLFFYQTQS